MPAITKNNAPSFVTVFETTDSDIEKIAHLSFQILVNEPHISAVIILRPTDTLGNTHKNLLETYHLHDQDEVFLVTFDKEEHIFKGASSLPPDCSIFLKFLQTLGVGSIRIITGNSIIHVDSDHFLYKDLAVTPGSLTMTMAIHGGGTHIIDAPLRFIKESPLFAEEKWIVPSSSEHPEDSQIWRVPDGAICLMRSNRWGASFPPCLHRGTSKDSIDSFFTRTVLAASVTPTLRL